MLSLSVVDLPAETSLAATLAGANVGGFGDASAWTDAVTTGPAVLPGPPRNAHAIVVNSSGLEWQWEPPQDRGGLPLDSYEACFGLLGTAQQRYPPTPRRVLAVGMISALTLTAFPSRSQPGARPHACLVTKNVTAAQPWLEVRHLSADTAYVIAIAARTAVGQGPFSALSSPQITLPATRPTVAGTPQCTGASGSMINLAWPQPFDFGGAAVSYEVLVVTASEGASL